MKGGIEMKNNYEIDEKLSPCITCKNRIKKACYIGDDSPCMTCKHNPHKKIDELDESDELKEQLRESLRSIFKNRVPKGCPL